MTAGLQGSKKLREISVIQSEYKSGLLYLSKNTDSRNSFKIKYKNKEENGEIGTVFIFDLRSRWD